MTVYVKDASKSVLSGLSKMKAAMIEDYAKFMVPDTDTKKKMNALKKFYGVGTGELLKQMIRQCHESLSDIDK